MSSLMQCLTKLSSSIHTATVWGNSIMLRIKNNHFRWREESIERRREEKESEWGIETMKKAIEFFDTCFNLVSSLQAQRVPRPKQIPQKCPRKSRYPVALIPGQYSDNVRQWVITFDILCIILAFHAQDILLANYRSCRWWLWHLSLSPVPTPKTILDITVDDMS